MSDWKNLWLVWLALGIATGLVGAQEVEFTNEELQKLDAFEVHTLGKADKVFKAGDHRQAAAEYDSYLLEFPRSRAVPYALLRKARSLQLVEKRYQAIKEYQEILDYFPNDVKYAAAALYFIGTCHWDNGDPEKAMKAWAEMAADVDYSKHYLAAGAINRLAENLEKQGKQDKAAEYYRQVAVDFRRTNRPAARNAIERAVHYFVRTNPNEPKLRELYQQVESFESEPQKLPENIGSDRLYWTRVRENVRRLGTFDQLQGELRDRHYRHWAQAMEGKFPDWDEYQIDLAYFHRCYENDVSRWYSRLNGQFQKYSKPDDFGRVVLWIQAYGVGGAKDKVAEYYQKLNFAKMSNDQINQLLRVFFEQVGDAALAKNVFSKFRLGEMTDAVRYDLERYLWDRDADLVREVCMTFQEKDTGRIELLRCYHWRRQHRGDGDSARKGLELADEAAASPRYASQALYMKGELLQWSRKFEDAIAVFRRADNPPANLFRMAECFRELGKLDQAVGQLREIENFFADSAPEASLRIAYYYREAGKKDLFVASLRNVLKKYPKSEQSSRAHNELEAMGVKIGGAVDAK